MTEQLPNVIATSYAKRALLAGSRERKRMSDYATVFGSYHLVVFTKSDEGFPSLQQDGKLFLHATNARTRIGMLWSAYIIGRRIIKNNRHKAWVVSGQDPFATSLVAVLLARYKHTALHVQIHGDVFNTRFFSGSFSGTLKTAFGKWVVRRAQKIRVVSQRIKDSLLELGVPVEKIAVVPVQSDLQTFLAVGERRVYVEKVAPTLLYVGRFSPEKNLPFLLEAFAKAKMAGLSGTLTLLGDGPQKEFLKTMCVRLNITDSVAFLPWSDNVAGVMAAADVFCLSSLHEGFAMVLVEAMAAGVPIVTTDVGCAHEVVKNDEHGIVTAVSDVTVYAAALQTLCDDTLLRARYGRAAHRAASDFTLSDSTYLHAIQSSFTL